MLAPAAWQAAGLLARHAVSDALALAARAEIFRDRDAGISGFAQRLREATATVEVKPADGLVVKLEGRYDRSTEKVFTASSLDAAGEPVLAEDQLLLVLGAVAGF